MARREQRKVICLPTLPHAELIDRVAAVVIIPAATFIRRLMNIPDSRYAEGHRVAALQWRDDAIALAVDANLITYSALQKVPSLAALLLESSLERDSEYDNRAETPSLDVESNQFRPRPNSSG
jgi:hypothetical protein